MGKIIGMDTYLTSLSLKRLELAHKFAKNL